MAKLNGRRFFLSAFCKSAASACLFGSANRGLLGQPNAGFRRGKVQLPVTDALYDPSLSSTSLRGEAADRLCIKRLIDGWAHYADRRLPVKQAGLFTIDGIVNNYTGDPAHSKPVSTLKGREEIRKALAVLNQFPMTFHFNGQSQVEVSADKAVGETYCIAHQILGAGENRKLQVLAIRYHDAFVRSDGRWLFEERNLIIDISDTRSSILRL